MRGLVPAAEALAEGLEDGLGLSAAVRRAVAAARDPAAAAAFEQVAHALDRGTDPAQAFERAFDDRVPIFSRIVRAGLEGGDLAASLRELGDRDDPWSTFQRRALWRLAYPAVVLATACVSFGAIGVWAMPSYRAWYVELPELPLPVAFVLGVMRVGAVGFPVAGLLSAAAAGALWWRAREVTPFEPGPAMLGTESLALRADVLRGLRAAAPLLRSGVPPAEALRLGASLTRSGLGGAFERVAARLEQGERVGTALEEELPSEAAVSELASRLDGADDPAALLPCVAEQLAEDLRLDLQQRAATVELVSLLCAAVVVTALMALFLVLHYGMVWSAEL